MDSVSQLVLGAGIAHVVLGPQIGRRALILGAVLGTLPDLDVLVRYDSAVESFTRHRSWSHSLLVLTLAAPPMAWLARKLCGVREDPWRWVFAVWLALATHPILDAFTVYGTQLWWPLNAVPAAWGSLFIIDPLFTVPMLTGVCVAWRRSGRPRVGVEAAREGSLPMAPGPAGSGGRGSARRASALGLLVGCTYIAVSLIAQHQARKVAVAELVRQGIAADALLVAPLPFSLLWRYVVLSGNEYHEGYHSLLDSTSGIDFRTYPKGNEALLQLDQPAEAARLRWFTQDFVRFRAQEKTLMASDLRMGSELFYVFEFALAVRNADGWQAMVPEQLPQNFDIGSLAPVVRRVWDERVDLAPEP